MCAVCRNEPCDCRCPNAPDPEPIHNCVLCGCGIYRGDKYWDSPDGAICSACVKDMSAEEILEVLGEELKEAKGEEW